VVHVVVLETLEVLERIRPVHRREQPGDRVRRAGPQRERVHLVAVEAESIGPFRPESSLIRDCVDDGAVDVQEHG